MKLSDPVTWIAGLLGVGAIAKKKTEHGADFGLDAEPNHGILTPGRQEFYERAMLAKADPSLFREAADRFERCGLPVEARMLRERAKSREASVAQHEARREIIRKCLASENPLHAEQAADICEKMGLTLSAEKLREYAAGLREKATLDLNAAQQVAETAQEPPPCGAPMPPPEPPPMASPDGPELAPELQTASGVVGAMMDAARAGIPLQTPNAGVWENEDDRAKGFEDGEGAFTRHAEK